MEYPRMHSKATICICHLENQTNCQSTSYPQQEFEIVNYISLTDTETSGFHSRMISFSFLHRDQSKRHNVRKIQNYTLKDLENASLQLQQWQFCLCVPVHPHEHKLISSAGLALLCICIQLSSSQSPKHQKFVEDDTPSTRRF